MFAQKILPLAILLCLHIKYLCVHLCLRQIWSITGLSGQLLAADSTLSPAACQVSFVLSINVDDELVPQVLYVNVSLFHSDSRLTVSGQT